jgi:GNAT superfamily N-acetyltransferase
MLIRPSLPKDADAIAELSPQLGYPAAPAEVSAYQAVLLPLTDHMILVAEADEGQLVGWIHVFVSRRLFVPPFAELGGIVVHEAHRRSGIGLALLARAEQWASQVGCSLLRIRSNMRRAAAGPFYLHAGYNQSKVQNVFEKVLT